MSDIVFQVETWESVIPEIDPLIALHHLEIGEDRRSMPLLIDHEGYCQVERAGQLLLVSARLEDVLVGYCVAFIRNHFHYAARRCGFLDLYYLLPECRRGMAGVTLFRRVEEELIKRGVVKMYASMKLKHDVGRVFERLGWRATDRVYSKMTEGDIV